jgi:hypothetical protein
MNGYNSVMDLEIKHRFGQDIFHKLWTRVEAEYNKKK